MQALRCVLEPVAIRKSLKTALHTYRDNGPSKTVWNITVGQVRYGRIESPGKLDSKVFGRAIIVASLIKGAGGRILATAVLVNVALAQRSPYGRFVVGGLSVAIELVASIEFS